MNSETITIKILIIEDEIHAQKELLRLLKNTEYSFHIEDTIDTVEDSVAWFNAKNEPDLVFMDIQLADGISFDIFNSVKISCPVIFTTAYDEYAIKAFKINSIDYLLKPIKQLELEAALNKYSNLNNKTYSNSTINDYHKIAELLNQNSKKYKSRFISRIGDQIMHIHVDDIAYFKSEDNVTFAVKHDSGNYIVDQSLDQIASLLDPDKFYRINRATITNIESIKKISKYFNSRLHVELSPKTNDKQLISRVKVANFLNWIER